MKKNLTLAIATSCFNEEANVKEFINRSQKALHCLAEQILIEQQLVLDYDIIVLDNGSHDNTIGVLKQLTLIHSNLKVFRNKINYGPEASMIKALSIAKSYDYVFTLFDTRNPIEIR